MFLVEWRMKSGKRARMNRGRAKSCFVEKLKKVTE
jgi:hypothetical protein